MSHAVAVIVFVWPANIEWCVPHPPLGSNHDPTAPFHPASALAGAVPQLAFAAGGKPRVGIIGAGIIGATIAAYLADVGAEVIVFEKEAPAAGATRASLAWINPSTVNVHYRDLRLQSMEEWVRLDQRLRLQVTWGGSLSWSDNDEKAKDLNKREEVLRGTRANRAHVTQVDISALCPYLAPGETKAGFYQPDDGHIDPVETTKKILAYAAGKGAKVIYPCAVEEILVEGGRVKGVRTTQGVR